MPFTRHAASDIEIGLADWLKHTPQGDKETQDGSLRRTTRERLPKQI